MITESADLAVGFVAGLCLGAVYGYVMRALLARANHTAAVIEGAEAVLRTERASGVVSIESYRRGTRPVEDDEIPVGSA